MEQSPPSWPRFNTMKDYKLMEIQMFFHVIFWMRPMGSIAIFEVGRLQNGSQCSPQHHHIHILKRLVWLASDHQNKASDAMLCDNIHYKSLTSLLFPLFCSLSVFLSFSLCLCGNPGTWNQAPCFEVEVTCVGVCIRDNQRDDQSTDGKEICLYN